MNKERFHSLAAAYGGAISRWPLGERLAARCFALCHQRAGRDILRAARRLDWMLQRSTSPDLGVELRGALIEVAQSLRETRGEGRSWFGAILGAGLTAACAAGVGVGFAVGPLTTDLATSPLDPAEVAASALGNPTEFGDG